MFWELNSREEVQLYNCTIIQLFYIHILLLKKLSEFLRKKRVWNYFFPLSMPLTLIYNWDAPRFGSHYGKPKTIKNKERMSYK